MSNFRHPIAALCLGALTIYACAKSGETDEDTSSSSTTDNTGGAGNSAGPSTGGSGNTGNTGNTGGTSAGGNTGGNSTGGNTGGTGGNAGGNGGNGGAGGQALTCQPNTAQDCEVCAADECTTQWNACCAATGCIDLARCVFEKCNADPLDTTCIGLECDSEWTAAGGIGGVGSTAGIALATCLDTELTNPVSNECQCCEQEVSGTGGNGGAGGGLMCGGVGGGGGAGGAGGAGGTGGAGGN